ncbi:STAS domain-containing protein [Bacillus sp. EB01]|uniref:STAS domain-containing protein n=1 Tax=Bacillus sp. EB01 TaxID=1347086 RepID=UPI0006945934|nr:STAS domain-containing protein [Bacillus sp. EB01]
MTEQPELKLLMEKNQQLENRILELENLVRNVSVPIIPSIIPGVILIPIAGEASPALFDLITPEILRHASNEEIDTAVLDFTAISVKELGDLSVLGHYLMNLVTSLNLIGVQVAIVGITPQFAQELVLSKLGFIHTLQTFSTFKAALQHLMKEKGIKFARTT